MRDGLGIEVKGQIWRRSTQGRMVRFKSFGKPLDVFWCAGVAKVDVFGQMSGPLKSHRDPTNDHELNARVVKNADRFLKVHFGTIWACLAISKMRAPSERLCARSDGERRRVEMNKVKSTPNFLALASSLPGGGFVTRSRTAFSWSRVIEYEYMFSHRRRWFNCVCFATDKLRFALELWYSAASAARVALQPRRRR